MKLMAYTDTAPRSEGTNAHRVVLRYCEQGQHDNCPFVVHLETFDKDGKSSGYHNGDYCHDLLEALAAFKRRVEKHFPAGVPCFDLLGKPIDLR